MANIQNTFTYDMRHANYYYRVFFHRGPSKYDCLHVKKGEETVMQTSASASSLYPVNGILKFHIVNLLQYKTHTRDKKTPRQKKNCAKKENRFFSVRISNSATMYNEVEVKTH